ncbi:hypothetical protein F2K02_22835, partial [Salmonella enterica subsp. enterica]|nr:hypothetical protein [Salmonella enterica subsp. enterica serovar Kintambo]
VLGRVESFVYDAAGNRLREEIRSRHPGTGSDTPEQNNNPDTEQQNGDDGWRCHAWLKDDRDNPLEHEYNRNGQMVARRRRKPGSWQREVITERLEWDVRGQLVRLCSDTQETRYGYDGLGRRVFKKTVKTGENTAALRWFWWEGDALMAEAQETADPTETCTAACDIQLPGSEQARKAKLTQLAQGLTLREYVYYPYSFEPLALITHRTGPDGGCGDKDPTAVYFYHNDVNGAPLRLTDRTGAVVWRQAESGAWNTRYRQEGLVSNPLRFQGQYYDEESGLHYNRYRYYEPESGRYISADPLKLGGGLNVYAYGPNPLSWIDPLGLARYGNTGGNGTTSDNSSELARNLEREGRPVGQGQAAGHVVASTGSKGHWSSAAESRDIITSYGIHINDAANGIPIDHPRPHNKMHTRDFHDGLRDRLKAIVSEMKGAGYGRKAIRSALRRELRKTGKCVLK